MKRKLTILTAALGVCAVLLFLYFFNPVETRFALRCPFKVMTGWSCAGCGMQRFLHAFMHGRFLEAFSYNYMLVILIPYVILFGFERLILMGKSQIQLRRVLEGKIVTISLCIIAPAWVIVRNILHI